MAGKLTKRIVDALAVPETGEAVAWCGEVRGFGVRARPGGTRAFILKYRPDGGGRSAPTRKITLGQVGAITVDQARALARQMLADLARGDDPGARRRERREALTLDALADLWMAEHVEGKRKPATADQYRHMLAHYVRPALGKRRAADVTRAEMAKLHASLREKRHTANRCLAVVGSMFAWAEKRGFVPEGTNPARGVEQFKEAGRERFLSGEELERLGAALREAETVGLPYAAGEGPRAKHAAKNRRSPPSPSTVAAVRLLLLTGCRLREVLHLEWSHVDLERGLLRLPDSKTGAKAVVLSAPAMQTLAELPRVGRYVIPGASAGAKDEKPRADLQRPWAALAKRAGIEGVRLHDLRHSFASVGAGASLGLPVLGKLLGHTQARTTQRYAHLDADPLRAAANRIASAINAAMGDAPAGGQLVRLKRKARQA